MCLNWILECVQVYHCEFIHVYNGPFDSIMITTMKTAWWWHVWCAKTCWRTKNVWRIHLVHVKLVLQTKLNWYLHFFLSQINGWDPTKKKVPYVNMSYYSCCLSCIRVWWLVDLIQNMKPKPVKENISCVLADDLVLLPL